MEFLPDKNDFQSMMLLKKKPTKQLNLGNGDCASIRIDSSRDSDSLIQDYYDGTSQENLHRSCFHHPKVRENWRMVLAATTLLFIGIGLLATGTMALAEPSAGAYHVVYIYLAAKGKRGYHFHNLPLFT
ncbi:hypothetical protein Trydic_g20559 [Trypoxylus dichotomus]